MERCFLTHEQAIDCLPEGDSIHIFKNPGVGMMLGADWLREDVIKLIHASEVGREIEVGGAGCMSMGHGLVIRSNTRPLFVEANTEKLQAYDKAFLESNNNSQC